MRVRRKRNITIGILCCMLVFMGIGYAALQQVLTINGTGNINGSWKIEITDISPEEINEGKSISTSIADSKIEGNFAANLKKPTDAVVYTVTVENKGTIDAVLESITPEDYASGDIKYTTTGKEECKNLDAGSSCNFTIKVEYLDTGAGQVLTPNGTEVKQEFIIKYVQEGANVNTPGGGSSGGEVDNSPAITVDSNGTVTGYNKAKLTNDEGWVVIPATTEDGEEIVSIDRNSFAEYNVSQTYVYNETTEEEMYAYVIYDEENYDQIESALLAMMEEDSGSGSGSYSSNSFVLGKDINPNNLVGNRKKNIMLEKLSGSGSGSEEMTISIYSKTEFDAVIKEMETTGKILAEHHYGYCDIETGEFGEATSQIEKLDLTQAVYLKTIKEYAFSHRPLKEVKLGNSVEIIEAAAFESTALTSVTIPSSVKAILSNEYMNTGAFQNTQLKSLIFEENSNLTRIEKDVFHSAHISGKVVIPSSVTTIGSAAFYNNDIDTLVFEDTEEAPSQLTTIGGYAFYSNQISNLVIPSSVTTIGDNVFRDNSELTRIVVRRIDSTGMNLDNNWNSKGYSGFYDVLWDPNYVG